MQPQIDPCQIVAVWLLCVVRLRCNYRTQGFATFFCEYFMFCELVQSGRFQLLNSTVVAPKQPWTTLRQMSMPIALLSLLCDKLPQT